MRLTRRAVAVLGSSAVLVAIAGVAQADPGGPKITYFKTANPVIGSTLSNSSDSPTVHFKDQVTVKDPDGICQASTTYSRTGNTVFSYSRGGTSVSHDILFTQLAGQSEFFSTDALDCLDNDAMKDSRIFTPNLNDEGDAQYSSGWTTVHNSAYSGGTEHQSSKVGAKATYSFENANMVALVSDHSSNGGTVSIKVDNQGAAKTVSLKGSAQNRVLVWKSLALTNGTRTVTIKVVSGRVDLDAFLLMQ